MTQIYGINGFKRAGKGETSLAIEALAHDRFQSSHLLGFADKLKILGARALGFIDGYTDEERIALMDEAKEEWLINIVKTVSGLNDVLGIDFDRPMIWRHLTGREYLQNLGNDARIVFGEDFWIDQVLPKPSFDPQHFGYASRAVSKRYPGIDNVVFTDLRYPNEAQRVLDLGGEVWEVIRPGLESDGHASEQVLPRHLVTRQIINDGTLMDLRYKVEKALEL